MIRVLHFLDRTTDETQLQALALLRHRLASLGVASSIAALDGVDRALVKRLAGEAPASTPRRIVDGLNWAPELGRVAGSFTIVHAWGIEAARTAAARLKRMPLVVTLLDPGSALEAAKWIRSLPDSATVAAGSQITRSRLLSAGLAPERVVVIRTGVDFSAINAARQGEPRKRLVGDAGPVILMHGPASRSGGQYYGLWAAAIVAQVHRGLRVVLPYDSPETRRLRRFVGQIHFDEVLVTPDRGKTWAELLAVADCLCVPAVDEINSDALAWAMAAGVVVVGTAVRSVAETIADRHNGLLCKPEDPRALAARLLVGIEDAELRRRVTDTARGQAYEVYSARGQADNYGRLYENVTAGRAAGEGITDAAMVA